ncbi:MAG: hypothetical protein AABY46_07855 [Nitrospirota bacterium]
MNLQQEALIPQIQGIVAEKILPGQRADEVDDRVLASLDSIGRLTLMVELENSTSVELMGPDVEPELFSSLARLAEFVIKKAAGQKSGP